MIYWDNNATTPLAPEVYEAMEPFLKERFFNPSAGYGCARHVREAVEEARCRPVGRISFGNCIYVRRNGGV